MKLKYICTLLIVSTILLISACKLKIEKVYLCPNCYKEYSTLQDAINCCTNTTENPADDINPNNLIINGKNFGKTEFVTIIPHGQTSTIHRENDLDENGRDYSDCFYSGRTVILSSYSMSKYEVTNELYEYVTGSLPVPDIENRYNSERQKYRPAAGINWYEAVIFCNKLSELCGYDKVYTIENISYANRGKPTQYVRSATVTWDFSKNGFRLPTEAEWEYAARGACKTENDWKYKYSGADNPKIVSWTSTNSAGYLDTDYILKTHEVGLKQPNALGIYDMSGNVAEWCMDYYRSVTELSDFDHGNRVNDSGVNSLDPCVGKGKYDNMVLRGGSYKEVPGYASLWQRLGKPKADGHDYTDGETYQGIRLVRKES